MYRFHSKTSKILGGCAIGAIILCCCIIGLVVLVFVVCRFVSSPVSSHKYPVPIQNSKEFFNVTGVKLPEIEVADSSYFSMPAFNACNATYRYVTPVNYNDVALQIRRLIKSSKHDYSSWIENPDNFSYPYGDSEIVISKTEPYELKIRFVMDTGSNDY